MLAAAFALAGAGCARDDATSEPVAAWQLERELVVGGADEGPASFSDVRGLAVDSRGRIHVLEAQEQQVRTFGADGTFLRAVGANGDGPGEFRGANGIAVDQRDQLWVYDPRARRVTVFDSSGSISRTFAVQSTTRGFIWSGGIDSVGRVYSEQIMRGDTAGTMLIIRTDPVAGLADTIPWPDCGAERPPMYRFRSDRSNGVIRVPFASGLFRRIDTRGYAWCADSRELRIHQYRFGDSVPVRTIVAAATPAPVTRGERDSAIAEVMRFGERVGKGEVDLDLIPPTKPVLQGIDFDAGAMWVRAVTSAGTELFIFDSMGRHIARAAFPGTLMEWHPMVARGDRVYVVTTDSLDVPIVARFRALKP